MMKNLILAISHLLLLTATSETDLSPVLVQCSNVTLSSDGDTGSCWKKGVSVMCNSLEHGLREAERLSTSMLVENTSQCESNDQCRLKSKPHEDNCFCTSALKFNTSFVDPEREKIAGTQMQLQQDQLTPNTSFQCSPGFVPHNVTSCTCLSNVADIVKCATLGGLQTAFIQNGFCMTYSNITGTIALAECIYSCPITLSLLDDKTSFNFLPENLGLLQEATCSKLNRQGFLCSECHDGYMPLAHSYRLKCVPCELSRRQLALNWMGYLTLAILPQSIIFLLMAIFRVGVTAPPFVSMVQVFQAMTSPFYVQAMIQILSCWVIPQKTIAIWSLYALVTFYGFFNLDFFRIVDHSLCLNLGTVELQLLDCASAFWPLILIVSTYILVELHSRGFKLVVLIWKPVQVFLGHFQREWHVKSSLVETFASFLLLSWIKLLSISFSLLMTTCVYTINDDGNVSMDCSHLHISPEMKIFDQRHLAFAIIAIGVFIIFISIPLLLLLFYPFKFFQSLLNRCGCNFRALYVFMDSF